MEQSAAGLEFLLEHQNADGGWAYFPGGQSWLEPTVYAALALHGLRDDAVGRAWALIRNWQNPDGGWRPNAAVPRSTWVTALAITLGDVVGQAGAGIQKGVDWLAKSRGAESSPLARALRVFGMGPMEREVKHKGWPWCPGTSAWVEPTAHALVALRRVVRRVPDRSLQQRIESGERMLLDTRCPDGGWNYGSPRALGVDLPSYPETTGLALVGLQRRAPPETFDHARDLVRNGASPLARAWLNIALRTAGKDAVDEGGDRSLAVASQPDILQYAVEALSAPDGNWALFRSEAFP